VVDPTRRAPSSHLLPGPASVVLQALKATVAAEEPSQHRYLVANVPM
jgi:hypothetical protein